MRDLSLELRGVIALVLIIVPASLTAGGINLLFPKKWFVEKYKIIFFIVADIITFACLAIEFIYILPTLKK